MCTCNSYLLLLLLLFLLLFYNHNPRPHHNFFYAVKKCAPQFYYTILMDSPPTDQFNVSSLFEFEFRYLFIYPTYIEAPLGTRYHCRHRDTMVSQTQMLSFLWMLVFIGEDDMETDTKYGIHSKKSLPIKSSFLKITSSRDQLQLDAKGLCFVFWCWEELTDVNNRLDTPDIPSTGVHKA